jgi:hypothetical protein
MDLILLALAASEQGDVDLGLPEYRDEPTSTSDIDWAGLAPVWGEDDEDS